VTLTFEACFMVGVLPYVCDTSVHQGRGLHAFNL